MVTRSNASMATLLVAIQQLLDDTEGIESLRTIDLERSQRGVSGKRTSEDTLMLILGVLDAYRATVPTVIPRRPRTPAD